MIHINTNSLCYHLGGNSSEINIVKIVVDRINALHVKASTRHFGKKKDKTMSVSVFSVILIEIYIAKIYI
jgi:hypothetical protein